MAQLVAVWGDPARAVDLLDEAERLYVSDFFPNVRPIAAIRARVWIAQRQLDKALAWQHEAKMGADDDLSYLREFEHISLARLLLAQQAHEQHGWTPRLLLQRLLEAAERGERNGSVVEIMILRALDFRHDDLDAALVALERALTLAQPEGYARLFINEGRPMEALLRSAVKRRIAPSYARQLLAGFSGPEAISQRHPDLIEPLSKRELDVLRLLRTNLGGPDIARELMASENTMRTHTKNIYEKLGVNSRRAAVRRGEELDLLARPKTR